MHINPTDESIDTTSPGDEIERQPSRAAFRGYPPGALPLLTALGSADRGWFAEHHADYVARLADPTKALVTSLGTLLQESVSSDLQAVPRVTGSIAPVATDRRFATTRNLPPYRDSLLLRFWEGDDKATAATLALRITALSVEFTASRSLPGPLLGSYREAVAGPDGAELEVALTKLRRRHDSAVDGRTRVRVPAPYPMDHPRADLLRHTWLRVRWSEPVPKVIGSARFPQWCERRLLHLVDVHRWLRDRV